MIFRNKLVAAMTGLGLCLGLAACDRTDERVDRLEDISRGVLDQLGGGSGAERDAMVQVNRHDPHKEEEDRN